MSRITILSVLLICLIALQFLATPISCKPKKPYKNVTKLQVGVKYRPEQCTRKSSPGDSVSVHYEGWLADTLEEFDSSRARGQPFEFRLGSGMVIQGWERGMSNACVGEKRRLVIPYDLAYGERGSGGKIPPKAALVFDVEIMGINGQKDEL